MSHPLITNHYKSDDRLANKPLVLKMTCISALIVHSVKYFNISKPPLEAALKEGLSLQPQIPVNLSFPLFLYNFYPNALSSHHTVELVLLNRGMILHYKGIKNTWRHFNTLKSKRGTHQENSETLPMGCCFHRPCSWRRGYRNWQKIDASLQKQQRLIIKSSNNKTWLLGNSTSTTWTYEGSTFAVLKHSSLIPWATPINVLMLWHFTSNKEKNGKGLIPFFIKKQFILSSELLHKCREMQSS